MLRVRSSFTFTFTFTATRKILGTCGLEEGLAPVVCKCKCKFTCGGACCDIPTTHGACGAGGAGGAGLCARALVHAMVHVRTCEERHSILGREGILKYPDLVPRMEGGGMAAALEAMRGRGLLSEEKESSGRMFDQKGAGLHAYALIALDCA